MVKLNRFYYKIIEYIKYDLKLLKAPLTFPIFLLGFILYLFKRYMACFKIIAKAHKLGWPWSEVPTEYLMRKLHQKYSRNNESSQLTKLCEKYVSTISPNPGTSKFWNEPSRMLTSAMIVLKSPAGREKGVILTNYSHYFPLLFNLFDIHEISRHYYIVLEPSWNGYCDEDVLCYTLVKEPVFVITPEPRDGRFLTRLRANFIPVPLGANWWVDHRVFTPLDLTPKDNDIIMIAQWTPWKRHASFFSSLKKLRSRGIVLRTCLIGYPMGYTMEDIRSMGRDYGVDDQLELHEWVSPEKVNYHLNRSKVNILWSRFEGCNRAIIEGMFAGIPCILRRGFNYGHQYAHINKKTGRFADDSDLHHVLLSMVERYDRFRPREWVLENMTCHKAIDILDQAIRAKALDTGEDWGGGLVPKVNCLHGMQYWDISHGDKFRADYQFLSSQIRALHHQ